MSIWWIIIFYFISSTIDLGSAWDEDPNRLPSKCESNVLKNLTHSLTHSSTILNAIFLVTHFE